MSLLKNEKRADDVEKKMDETEKKIVADFDAEIKRQDRKPATVKISPLNIRSIPSLGGEITGVLNEGDTAVIVDEKDGWGKLKDGGWVLLDYVSR